MENTIEIHYKGTIHYIYPESSLTYQQIQDRLLSITMLFNDNTVAVDEVDWIWCLVGNVVDEHEFGENKEIRKGTKQFAPGTKVYCFPHQWGDGYEKIKVIGKPRKRNALISVIMKSELITNWRLKQVYDPFVITYMLTNFGWNNSDYSKQQIENMVSLLKEREQNSMKQTDL